MITKEIFEASTFEEFLPVSPLDGYQYSERELHRYQVSELLVIEATRQH